MNDSTRFLTIILIVKIDALSGKSICSFKAIIVRYSVLLSHNNFQGVFFSCVYQGLIVTITLL